MFMNNYKTKPQMDDCIGLSLQTLLEILSNNENNIYNIDLGEARDNIYQAIEDYKNYTQKYNDKEKLLERANQAIDCLQQQLGLEQ